MCVSSDRAITNSARAREPPALVLSITRAIPGIINRVSRDVQQCALARRRERSVCELSSECTDREFLNVYRAVQRTVTTDDRRRESSHGRRVSIAELLYRSRSRCCNRERTRVRSFR